MARSIATIRAGMTADFMANETLASAYGFTPGASFDSTFSRVSIESILLFTVASAIWVLESLFDTHRQEMNDLLATKKPHRLKWYRDKALAFQFGRSLKDDEDVYDTIVDSERVVKYASAVEYQGKLYIKVAGGSDADKHPILPNELTALNAYFAEVKDAGVKLEIVNEPADHIRLSIDIYYDPMVFSSSGLRNDNGADTIRDTIKAYLQNLPFNGEYRNADLIDRLQALDGVVIPEMKDAQSVSHADYGGAWTAIQAKALPVSGYYKIYSDSDLTLRFVAYQTIESV